MERLKSPLTLAATSSAALLIFGATLGWFGFDNELVRSYAEEELATKQTAAMTLGFLGILITGAAAYANKRFIAIAAALLSMYATAAVYNQLPDSESAELLGISTGIGFWLSLVGAIAATLTNFVIAFKGFDLSE